ncbi:MAG: sugar kinase [Deltaproteobacteria bacterium]|nr:sugar kinase [Deltaproteobacteria bacterium]
MLAIVGTVPDHDTPIIHGPLTLHHDRILLDGRAVSVNRGTSALMAASVVTLDTMGKPAPYGFLVGDVGRGTGSRHLLKYLTDHFNEFDIDTLTLHYLQPITHWHDKLLHKIEALKDKPVLIADAGFMYAAKMSGHAESYDLFTPDVGELAFLADESAPHPFYTRGFILHEENRAADLIARAYSHKNAAKNLLVKGENDYIVQNGKIIETVSEPSEDAMEAIGGTGDSLTGIVSALIAAGYTIPDAAVAACKINRMAGHLAKPTPASSIMDIVMHIPEAVGGIFVKGSENCV